MKISFTGGIRLNSGNGAEHTLLLTPTRKGKSMLVKGEADRLGISYEEMECRLEPTPEQKEKARMRKEEKIDATQRGSMRCEKRIGTTRTNQIPTCRR